MALGNEICLPGVLSEVEGPALHSTVRLFLHHFLWFFRPSSLFFALLVDYYLCSLSLMYLLLLLQLLPPPYRGPTNPSSRWHRFQSIAGLHAFDVPFGVHILEPVALVYREHVGLSTEFLLFLLRTRFFAPKGVAA